MSNDKSVFTSIKIDRALIVPAIVVVIFTAVAVSQIFRTPSDDQFGVATAPVSFEDLDGWRDADKGAALSAFQKTCQGFLLRADDEPANDREVLGEFSALETLSGRIADWRPACDQALAGVADAGAFFEQNFTPHQLVMRAPRKAALVFPLPAVKRRFGLITGYFEPLYEGSLAQTDRFSAPLLTRPDDLVMADLGVFRDELAGQRIAGRVRNGRLEPYEDREKIETGALAELADTIAWLNPVDAFFLQIQGSGRVVLDGGDVLRVGYAGQNGHPYTAIGRLLVENGDMVLEDVSMDSIRDWLKTNPERAMDLMRENASFVFFTETAASPDDGPTGTAGVALTARASVAVDRRYTPLGAPVWIEADGANADEAIRMLLIAQDTGGAIQGPLRADIFWGSGQDAGRIAGGLRAEGAFFLLLPNELAARVANGE